MISKFYSFRRLAIISHLPSKPCHRQTVCQRQSWIYHTGIITHIICHQLLEPMCMLLLLRNLLVNYWDNESHCMEVIVKDTYHLAQPVIKNRIYIFQVALNPRVGVRTEDTRFLRVRKDKNCLIELILNRGTLIIRQHKITWIIKWYRNLK